MSGERVKRGVLGGTFNPVHAGHLRIAEEVRRRLDLVEVLFVPAGEPWMKGGEELAPREDRWEMVARAIAGQPGFAASRVDIDRLGPTYAVDTVRDLQRRQPGPAEYHFIMGMDALEGLPQWKEPERLLELCRLVVVTRPGYAKGATFARAAEALPALLERTTFVEGVRIDISASEVRLRVRHGLSITGFVPEAVEAYILEHGLYR